MFSIGVSISHPQGGAPILVDRELVLADQGSDINIIYPPLPKKLSLKTFKVKDLLHSQAQVLINTAGMGSVILST